MKKKIIAIVLAIATIISVCAMFSLVSYADYGNKITKTVSVQSVNANTKLCSLKKCYPNSKHSNIKVHKNGSEINKMNVWLKTSGGTTMSKKYRVYPDDNLYVIYYYEDQTFPTGADVVFWGEQANVAKKNAKFTAYSY